MLKFNTGKFLKHYLLSTNGVVEMFNLVKLVAYVLSKNNSLKGIRAKF